jgi:hypothetical protein
MNPLNALTYPLVSDLNVNGDTLVLILVVLAIIALICIVFWYGPWRR